MSEGNCSKRVVAAKERKRSGTTIPRITDDVAAPLSFGQERLLFLHHLAPGSVAYHRPACFRLSGNLDRMLLERCLDEIFRRHTVLRTRFQSESGEPRQVISDDATIPLPFEDLTAFADPQRDSSVRQIILEETRAPFQLEGGSLRAVLKITAQEHLLLLTFHHAIFDAWSERMRREIALYRVPRRPTVAALRSYDSIPRLCRVAANDSA
jgi:hypothetical protein